MSMNKDVNKETYIDIISVYSLLMLQERERHVEVAEIIEKTFYALL